ncbi:thioredoxin family protein [Chryseomicrobium sp. FSL W7-1435]|uniref:thioredoxin family protein n=1 Tax=Chryseomicrobium sp. FSL W7-1435 TaxID=2921704 RepID=UPI003159B5FD
MKEIRSYEQWQQAWQQPKGLLFVKTTGCSVCEGLLPQVEAIENDYKLPFYKVNSAEVPEVAGQLSLYTAPVVLLWHEGREVQRFARFVPMQELKFRLGLLNEVSPDDL